MIRPTPLAPALIQDVTHQKSRYQEAWCRRSPTLVYEPIPDSHSGAPVRSSSGCHSGCSSPRACNCRHVVRQSHSGRQASAFDRVLGQVIVGIRAVGGSDGIDDQPVPYRTLCATWAWPHKVMSADLAKPCSVFASAGGVLCYFNPGGGTVVRRVVVHQDLSANGHGR